MIWGRKRGEVMEGVSEAMSRTGVGLTHEAYRDDL